MLHLILYPTLVFFQHYFKKVIWFAGVVKTAGRKSLSLRGEHECLHKIKWQQRVVNLMVA